MPRPQEKSRQLGVQRSYDIHDTWYPHTRLLTNNKYCCLGEQNGKHAQKTREPTNDVSLNKRNALLLLRCFSGVGPSILVDEKTQMHMLESSGSTIGSSVPSSSNRSLVGDQDLSERLSSKAGRWIYVDWLEWMGDITGAPAGRISCPSPGCGCVRFTFLFGIYCSGGGFGNFYYNNYSICRVSSCLQPWLGVRTFSLVFIFVPRFLMLYRKNSLICSCSSKDPDISGTLGVNLSIHPLRPPPHPTPCATDRSSAFDRLMIEISFLPD